MQRQQSGFTLIEISIVLVIIGLILGGALKGQELITSAKVRSSINQIDGVKAAYYAFQDRYRALPGDYIKATDNLPNPPASITIADGDSDGIIDTAERSQVWAHLGMAGFLSGDFDGAAGSTSQYACPTTSCLPNPFGGTMSVSFDNEGAGGATGNTNQLITGRWMPVGVIAEIDRKIDDGTPTSGIFQSSSNGAFSACRNGDAWDISATSPRADCAGVIVGL